MAWKVRDLAPAYAAVELTYSGVVDRADLEASYVSTFELASASDTWHVLCDLSEVTGGHSLFDLYALVTAVSTLGLGNRFREALLVIDHPEVVERAHFWETASVNRGVAARAFTDRDAALAWLTRP
jgi:hypothetical protein